jgi:hypothetical protein
MENPTRLAKFEQNITMKKLINIIKLWMFGIPFALCLLVVIM